MADSTADSGTDSRADSKQAKRAKLVNHLSNLVSQTFPSGAPSKVRVAGKAGRDGLEVTLTMPRDAVDPKMANELMGLLLDQEV